MNQLENVINFKASCLQNENEIQESSVYGIKLTPSDIRHKIKNLKYFTYTCLLSECIRPTVTQRLCNTETTDGEI